MELENAGIEARPVFILVELYKSLECMQNLFTRGRNIRMLCNERQHLPWTLCSFRRVRELPEECMVICNIAMSPH